tara:strand:- start:830 stop:1114 length:285 start_codon:yes stop_codon:yes gene_type:complete
MFELKKKTSVVNTIDMPTPTKHFINRYYQRILKISIPNKAISHIKKEIINDMLIKMTQHEKNALCFLRYSNKAEIPFSRSHRMIVKNNYLVTIF